MDGLVGHRLGRYHIVSAVGEGGMGKVYRARDTELDRDVAVKVISGTRRPSENSVARFEREVKIVAQLSHPNILEIYDFGREEGTAYAVTEYLDGEDLRARCRGAMLPVSKVLEIGIGIANGLAAAHAKGVIHRDIKPENVFVTSAGQVKILDFGIAGLRVGDLAGSSGPGDQTRSLTGSDGLVGTVGYMSPEQIRGETLDPRSDIFALGCLLYELLTGRRAFQADQPAQTIRAILERDPTPACDLRPDAPPALEAVIGRCLEKRRDERFESARDVSFALQAMVGRRTALSADGARTATRSRGRRVAILGVATAVLLAVLGWIWLTSRRQPMALPTELHAGVVPFTTSESSADLEAFADGIRLELIDDLDLIAQEEPGLGWIVPAEEAQASGAVSAAELGEIYGVTVAVEGRFERVSDRLRLNLTVRDPATGRPLRETVIEDAPGNLEAFQHGPAASLAAVLDLAVSAATQSRIDAASTTMTDAFDRYVRGRGIFAGADGRIDRLRSALDLVDEAVSDDPIFAGALVLRARIALAMYRTSGDPSWLGRGLHDARRALDLDGRAEDAWKAIADLQLAAGETTEAIESLESAVAAAPSDTRLRLLLGQTYDTAGRPDAAEQHIRKAIFLRPDYWPGYEELARLELSQGDLESAAIEFGHIIDCAPDYALAYVKLAGVYMYLEQPEAARPLLERSLEIAATPWALTNLGSIHFDESRFSEAAKYYRAALELEPDDPILWGNLGYACRNSGEPVQAEGAFDRAAALAEKRLQATPDDLELSATLAGYYAQLGEVERGLELLDPVAAAEPTDPILTQLIAESFEDLGDRERALDWVSRSFAAGVPPERFERRPTNNKLIADERYQALVSVNTGVS